MTDVLNLQIQKKISNFVASQFPRFYREEGDMFIQFVKAYYEWMEQSSNTGNITTSSRNLLEYKDIDDTVDQYLVHFQEKYLYGMPLYFQGDKRFLLKHVLDVYRSKGTIEGYKLLFKLLYNEDIEVYLPKDDILRASDGQWIKQKYLELTYSEKSKSLEKLVVAGAFSGATAVAENYVRRNINGRLVNILYISNIAGNFIINEPIIPYSMFNDQGSLNLKDYPYIAGSVGSISIVDGGQDFTAGDILITTSALGTGAKFNVTNSGPKRGITFYLRSAGSGFSTGAVQILSRTGTEPYVGNSAAFTYSILYGSPETYSADIIAGYENLTINTSAYGMSGNIAANVNNAINNAITYVTAQFGQLSNVVTSNAGLGYVSNPRVTLRNVITTPFLSGNVSFSNTGRTLTGNGTSFTKYFTGNSIIKLVGGYSGAHTDTSFDYRIVQTVVDDTTITLDDYPNLPSNTSANFRLSFPTWEAQFAPNLIYDGLGDIFGQNENIEAIAGIGNGTILTAEVIASGLSYNTGELISAVKASSINSVTIRSGGSGYANGENLVFAGGGTNSIANGYINTFSNGTISAVNLLNQGSGYQSTPVVKVQTANGTGAVLVAVVGPGTSNVITGQVSKVAVGYEEGYWLNTRGFLNSDKYIQDSYYYQDYSYSLKSGIDFTKYADVIKKVFHIAGTEIFGNPYIVREETSTVSEGDIEVIS